MYIIKYDSVKHAGKTELEKKAEVDTKINKYKQDQKNQLKNGGPGAVAEFDIMSIVNDHSGVYELENGPEVTPNE